MNRDPNPELSRFVRCVLREFREQEILCKRFKSPAGANAYEGAAEIIRAELAAIRKRRKVKR